MIANDRAQPLLGIGNRARRNDNFFIQRIEAEVHDPEEQVFFTGGCDDRDRLS